MVQDDVYLWVVLRYIEVNPIRAAMVADQAAPLAERPGARAGASRSTSERDARVVASGRDAASRRTLWREEVAAAPPEADLTAVRQSLRDGRPFGRPEWAVGMSPRLAVAGPPRSRGRPRKAGK